MCSEVFKNSPCTQEISKAKIKCMVQLRVNFIGQIFTFKKMYSFFQIGRLSPFQEIVTVKCFHSLNNRKDFISIIKILVSSDNN